MRSITAPIAPRFRRKAPTKQDLVEALDAVLAGKPAPVAKTEVMELTKRNVPGVWTYGFYDGWTPNYMFFAAHAHNATGRYSAAHHHPMP